MCYSTLAEGVHFGVMGFCGNESRRVRMELQQISRYQIKNEIGRGGMATVYQAYDPRFQRDVAIKVLPREFLHDPQFRHRFEREAQTIAALEHPAIVPVYDFGEETGQLYLVMRLMTGGTLTQRLQAGPLPEAEIARIINRIAPALDSAHSLGIVHRDRKPDNILFDQWQEPYISDFGIAKLMQSSRTVLTVTGGLVGTPAYMSPEQVRGMEEVDGRSDIYSLGIIFFEILTGQKPFQANTPIGLAFMHVNEPIPRLIAHRADIPLAYQRLLEQVLAKDRTQRLETAVKFSRSFHTLLTTPQPTQPHTPPHPPTTRGLTQNQSWRYPPQPHTGTAD